MFFRVSTTTTVTSTISLPANIIDFQKVQAIDLNSSIERNILDHNKWDEKTKDIISKGSINKELLDTTIRVIEDFQSSEQLSLIKEVEAEDDEGSLLIYPLKNITLSIGSVFPDFDPEESPFDL